jgi:peptidoglycan/xylan/chitin deacetylase (PgdA/CDA1 family)
VSSETSGPAGPGGQEPGAGPARAAVTRRVLLAAGGLTLLAGCASDPRQQIVTTAQIQADAARPAAARPGAARPAASHPDASRRGRPDRANSPAARRGARPDPGEPMYYVHDGPKAIALTIDDGPSPVYTPQLLRLLDKHRVKAAFSMIGIEVDAYPGVAREVADAGHTITNHTWTHPDLALLAPAAVADQVNRATEAIHRATGRVPRLFRAPYGAWSPAVFRCCAQTRMTPVDWSVDPRDWSRPGVAAIVGNILENTRTGSIILEHDGGGDRSQTVAALKIVLPRLLAAGYHFRIP